MKRCRSSILLFMIVIVLLLSSGCTTDLEDGEVWSETSPAEADKIARDFIEQSPIYLSYGHRGTLELVWTKKPADGEGLELVYEFESSRLGYTCDITDFMVSSEGRYIQTVNIIVREAEITSARMIGRDPDLAIPERIVWDMLKQEITET